MATYIILSNFAPGIFEDASKFKERASTVSTKIRNECPAVKWKESFGTTGSYDVVDIVESDDPKQVEKAAMIIKRYGLSHVDTMFAMPWKEFLNTL
jgi:uncharacterized protein with GYD domain